MWGETTERDKVSAITDIMIRWSECLDNLKNVPELELDTIADIDASTAGYALKTMISGLKYATFHHLLSNKPDRSYDKPTIEEYVAFSSCIFLARMFKDIVASERNTDTVWFVDSFDLDVTIYEIHEVTERHRKDYTTDEILIAAGAFRRGASFVMEKEIMESILWVSPL